MSVEKTTKVAAKKRGRPAKTSDKRTELMKRAEEATKKQYSEFDLHNAKKEAFDAGFEAGEKLNDIAENVGDDLTKWVRRQVVGEVALRLAILILVVAIVVASFTTLHGWAMNLA